MRAERQSTQGNRKQLDAVVHIIRSGTDPEECREIAQILRQVAASCNKSADWWDTKACQGGVS